MVHAHEEHEKAPAAATAAPHVAAIQPNPSSGPAPAATSGAAALSPHPPEHAAAHEGHLSLLGAARQHGLPYHTQAHMVDTVDGVRKAYLVEINIISE